jgi:hypothetical protein
MMLAWAVPVSNRRPRRIRRGSLPTGNPQSTSPRLPGLAAGRIWTVSHVRALPALLKRLPGDGADLARIVPSASRISFKRLPSQVDGAVL